MWDNRVACLRVIGITAGGTVAYYTWVVAAPTQAISVRGMDSSAVLWTGVWANAVLIAVLPLFGILSDRIGRKPVLYIAYLGGAVLFFPLNMLVQDQVWQLALSLTVAMIFIAPGAAILPAVYAEMFPTHVRTSGVAFPYAIVVAACGGSAPYLQTWLEKSGIGWAFLVYTVVLLLVSLLVASRMPETKGADLRQ